MQILSFPYLKIGSFQGTSFTKIPYQDSLKEAAVGLDAEVGQHDVEGFEFEILWESLPGELCQRFMFQT